MSQDARRDEEQSTLKRASILGLKYIDTSKPGDKPIYKEILSIPELYKLRVIPVQADKYTIQFGITNMTSQVAMTQLRQRFLDQRISFGLISDTGYKEYMRLYDPPKAVIYQDIELTTAVPKIW